MRILRVEAENQIAFSHVGVSSRFINQTRNSGGFDLVDVGSPACSTRSFSMAHVQEQQEKGPDCPAPFLSTHDT